MGLGQTWWYLCQRRYVCPAAFSIAKANQLLNRAGYAMGSNGIRVADGHPMSYNVIFPPDERGSGDRTFQIMQADFKKIGIQISGRQRGVQRDLGAGCATSPGCTG